MKKSKKFLIFIIFLFSFFLVGGGLYLLYDSKKIIDPVKDVEIIVTEDGVNITDNADEEKPQSEESQPGEVTEQESNSEPIPDNSNNNVTTNSNTNSSGNNSNSDTNSNPPALDTSDSQNVQQSQQITIEQENDNFRINLQNTYNVKIFYGNEVSGYSVGGMSSSIMTDPYKIKSVLLELSEDLSHYPPGFFREFSTIGMNLSIYLIERYSNNYVTGVTDTTNNNVVISIATAYSFSESFNHEVYHYMERYIEKRSGNFNSWASFNPVDFSYGSTNSTYSFTNAYIGSSYFVNDYAQTSEDEDRASTFEYMMANNKTSCFGINQPIWLKASFMANVIDVYFTTVNSYTVEYWERFL